MTIRAAVMTQPDAPLEVWDIDEPVLEDGGVLLETVASEVCGTDVLLHHRRLAGVPYPIIPGHVSVGRVLEARGTDRDAVGAKAGPGDVVTFYDVHEVCNSCYFCTVARQPNRCPSRRVYRITYSAHDGPVGGWAEQIYLKPGVRIVKLPDGIDADDVLGAAAECSRGLRRSSAAILGSVHRLQQGKHHRQPAGAITDPRGEEGVASPANRHIGPSGNTVSRWASTATVRCPSRPRRNAMTFPSAAISVSITWLAIVVASDSSIARNARCTAVRPASVTQDLHSMERSSGFKCAVYLVEDC